MIGCRNTRVSDFHGYSCGTKFRDIQAFDFSRQEQQSPLNRWTRHRVVRTKHATVAQQALEAFARNLAVIEGVVGIVSLA
jgi:hypothetical protein